MAVTTPTTQGRSGRTALELDGASLTVRDALEVSRRGRTVRLSETRSPGRQREQAAQG